MDAVQSGMKPCDLAKEALHQHPLTPFTLGKAIIVGYLGIFSVYWIFCFLRFFSQLKDILDIRQFYYNSLCVTDSEIQTMAWTTVLEKVVLMQSSRQLCVVKDLSAHEMVMRLMRKENYLIGMLNKGLLAFPISSWVPGVGPTVKFGTNGIQYRLVLTKTLEWTLNWCILQSMFDRNFCVRRDFLSNPRTLKKRLKVVGLAMLSLSPFLVIFMVVYHFLRHAEQFYNHPSTASSRRWSNLSRWVFREFNEVDHLFRHRVNSSVLHASDYIKQFPSPIISIIAKFVSFVSGGFAAVLIIIAFLEESLLEGHRVNDILQFISDFTVDVEGVGHVCSFSVFEEKLQAKLEEKFQLFAKAVLDPSNSRLNVEALAAMFTTPPNATSAPRSSTSTHAPEAHRENDEGDEGLDGMDDEEFEDIC